MGRKVKSSHFACYFLPVETEKEHSFVGIAVSKANGNAVKRVRAKRQVRAMLAATDVLSWRIYLIIVIRPSYKEGAFHENEVELNQNLDKIKELTNLE